MRGYVSGAHMPGDPNQCRLNAQRYLVMAAKTKRPEQRQRLLELAQTWKKLAAEIEADQALLRTLAELDFGEPCQALPFALRLYSTAA